MKRLYRRLAVTNLKSNKQFYIPYTLMGMLCAVLFYSMRAIQGNNGILSMRGAGILYMVLTFGLVIIGICVCIFLFYTNSFVMKRRKKELGMFNILGMEKKHIMKVLFWEALILYVLSVSGGLAAGIVLNKLLTMFLYKLTGLSESIPFYISWWGCLQTAELFGAMYLLILAYNFLQVKLANPIELLHSSNAGEREPKVKWLNTILGLACILTGYYFAGSTHDLIKAINLFFIAVILVIIGTYELFISISIAFLKMLRKNKRYYYQTRHFITISGMLYRMKQNAVGLANICILSTMVMVTVSTTVCLYAGTEDTLLDKYGNELNVEFYYEGAPNEAQQAYLRQQLNDLIAAQNREVTNMSEYYGISYLTYRNGNAFTLSTNGQTFNLSNSNMLYIRTRSCFEAETGQTLTEIPAGQVVIASVPHFKGDTVEVFGELYQIAGFTDYPGTGDGQYAGLVGGDVYLIAEDTDTYVKLRSAAGKLNPELVNQTTYRIMLGIDGTLEEKKACAAAIRGKMYEWWEQAGFVDCILHSIAEERDELLELNGGFFFLGLFLGTMFLTMTVLIIYYKQISEGYGDRERFAILLKVGMSHSEAKTAIRSQVRTIFFLPISVAVLHLIAAFPMLRMLLQMFSVDNKELFIWCLFGTAAIFMAIYFMVFKLTSQSYYKIIV